MSELFGGNKKVAPAKDWATQILSKQSPASTPAPTATVSSPYVAAPIVAATPEEPKPTATVDALGKAARRPTILTPPAATQTYGVTKLG